MYSEIADIDNIEDLTYALNNRFLNSELSEYKLYHQHIHPKKWKKKTQLLHVTFAAEADFTLQVLHFYM